MNIHIYKPHQQGTGAFDGGKITEQKPIGFPGEGSAVDRIGPLFYWSWAKAEREGYIAPHPHKAFEILTYVINGHAEHGDSLGTKSVVGPGGAQVMQTGSGVFHEEKFVGPDMEGFQIWFEPYMREAINRTPTYRQFEHQDFPAQQREAVQIKTVIGEKSPIQLVADVKMWDITVKNTIYRHRIPQGYSLAALAVRGSGAWSGAEHEDAEFEHRDFSVLQADRAAEVALHSNDHELRMILIQVPHSVDYPLYPK